MIKCLLTGICLFSLSAIASNSSLMVSSFNHKVPGHRERKTATWVTDGWYQTNIPVLCTGKLLSALAKPFSDLMDEDRIWTDLTLACYRNKVGELAQFEINLAIQAVSSSDLSVLREQIASLEGKPIYGNNVVPFERAFGVFARFSIQSGVVSGAGSNATFQIKDQRAQSTFFPSLIDLNSFQDTLAEPAFSSTDPKQILAFLLAEFGNPPYPLEFQNFYQTQILPKVNMIYGAFETTYVLKDKKTISGPAPGLNTLTHDCRKTDTGFCL